MRKMHSMKVVATALLLLFVWTQKDASAQAYKTAKTPKNIILLISDGCGYNQIRATNYYMHGKASAQPYQKFPLQYAVSTYCAKTKLKGDAKTWNVGYNSHKAWSDLNS